MKREQKTLELISEYKLNGTIVEVGVLRGLFSKWLLKANPKELFLIDCWEALPIDEFPDYVDYTQEKWDSIMVSVFKKFVANSNVSIIKGKSNNVVNSFSDNSIDLVYLDGNHTYEFVKQDLAEWFKKLKAFMPNMQKKSPGTVKACLKG